MGIEIERRFLIENEDWKALAINKEKLKQGYLNSNIDGWTVRVRIIDKEKSFITLKSSLDGFTNHEFEYSIPIQDAIQLLNLSKNKLIKTRYSIKIKGRLWVVDSFEDFNDSLTIAENELESELEEIEVPSWCGQEITGIKSLSNASLAKTPISKLSIKDRMKAKDP